MTAVQALAHLWLSRSRRTCEDGESVCILDTTSATMVQRLQRFATLPWLKQKALLRIVEASVATLP